MEEMKKYKGLQIDVLGKCGSIHNSKIPNRAVGWEAAYEILAQQYKFYLSFENTKCYEYITEKLFTAMKAGILPVAMGGLSRKDYEKILPPHSFIHVDDFSSPMELMIFLEKLSKDPNEYNSYFWWKSHYDMCCIFKGPSLLHVTEMSASIAIDSKCKLCEVLNSENYISLNNYKDFNNYWDKCR